MTAPDASRLSLAELLDQIEQLQKKATPGPWAAFPRRIAQYFDPADAALLVAAVNALPLLLSELSRLQEARDSGVLTMAAEWFEELEPIWEPSGVPSDPFVNKAPEYAAALRALAGEP